MVVGVGRSIPGKRMEEVGEKVKYQWSIVTIGFTGFLNSQLSLCIFFKYKSLFPFLTDIYQRKDM